LDTAANLSSTAGVVVIRAGRTSQARPPCGITSSFSIALVCTTMRRIPARVNTNQGSGKGDLVAGGACLGGGVVLRASRTSQAISDTCSTPRQYSRREPVCLCLPPTNTLVCEPRLPGKPSASEARTTPCTLYGEQLPVPLCKERRTNAPPSQAFRERREHNSKICTWLPLLESGRIRKESLRPQWGLTWRGCQI